MNKIIFQNLPSTATPLNATNLNKMQEEVEIVTTTNTNLNNYINAGVYYFSSSYAPQNAPTINGWLQVFNSSSTAVKQIWYRQGTLNSNDYMTYVRTKMADSWSDWVQLQTI